MARHACAAALLLWGCGCGPAWLAPLPKQRNQGSPASEEGGEATPAELGRRGALSATAAAGFWMAPSPESVVHASGGSTAGKYSTIPSAKRRFYGRVRMGIYKFLQMEPAIMGKGDPKDPAINEFFGKTIVKVKGGVEVKGCAWSDECITKEKRTSRWNDFRLASDLLGCGFRYSAEDIDDRLPQVKLIRAFAKKIDKMKIALDNGEVEKAQELYKKCRTELNKYTAFVELAPLTSEDYTHEWDTRPQVFCQGTFCV